MSMFFFLIYYLNKIIQNFINVFARNMFIKKLLFFFFFFNMSEDVHLQEKESTPPNREWSYCNLFFSRLPPSRILGTRTHAPSVFFRLLSLRLELYGKP